MKTLLYVCAALVLTLGTASVRAADVTGTWSTEMKTPDGQSFPLTFTFKQDGVTLTGTVQGPQGDPIDISIELTLHRVKPTPPGGPDTPVKPTPPPQ